MRFLQIEDDRVARVDVIMPQMGESIAEGTVSRWLKKVGDNVKRDEPLFEISTDKVDAEIPSPTAGILVEILIGEGQTVAIQTVVARLETDAAAAASAPPAPPSAPAAAPASAPVTASAVTPAAPVSSAPSGVRRTWSSSRMSARNPPASVRHTPRATVPCSESVFSRVKPTMQ
jgi:2-oxoglutarate dehydrogenase E2 component (dihydrolipoamide succinyltransferase)